MADIVHTISVDAAQLLRTMDDVNSAMDENAEATGEAGKASKGMSIQTKVLGQVLRVLTAGVAKGIADAVAYADVLGKMSTRTGISTEALSGLALVASKSDTSIQTVAKGMATLSKGMLDAATKGTGPAAEALEILGISATDANGKLKDSESIFKEVATGFKGMENGAQKAALAQKLFGGSGRELIPLLNQGADGLEENARLAADLGIVWSQDTVVAAEELNDSIATLKTITTGFVSVATQALLPLMSDIAQGALLAAKAFLQLGTAEAESTKAGREDAQARIIAKAELIDEMKVRGDSREAIDAEIDKLRRLKGELGAQAGLLTDEIRAQRAATAARSEAIAVVDTHTGASRRGSGASKAAADAFTAEAAAAQELADAQGMLASISEELISTSQNATDALMGDSDLLIAQKDREVSRINELEQSALSNHLITEEEKVRISQEAAAARTAVQAELGATLAEMEAEATEASLEAAEEAAEAKLELQMETEEQILEVVQEGLNTLGDIFSMIQAERESAAAKTADKIADIDAKLAGDLSASARASLEEEKAVLEEEVQAQKDAALAAWIANKVVAVAQAAINIPLAISGALTTPGPVGIALAVVAGIAAGAALVAVIAQPPPTFHDGGILSDEMDIRALSGEVMLSNPDVRALGGPSGVEQAIAGGGGGQNVTIVQKLDHKVVDIQTSKALDRTGSPLDGALRSRTPRKTGRRNPYQPRV